MTVISLIKKVIPKPARQLIKKAIKVFSEEEQLIRIVAPNLPGCVCIDVGASYYPHPEWELFRAGANTSWVAVEPNEKNIAYVKSWGWPSKVRVVPTGLSREGGRQTLYVTNVDSGSSLLKPEIRAGMKHRVGQKGLDYFFPMREVQVDTITLSEVISRETPGVPIFVKLDTQGSELSILQGAHSYLESKRVVGIEMESTLLAQPYMHGSGKFWEACEYLERLDFELLDIYPISALTNLDIKSPRGRRYMNECDAVFALRRDVVQTLSVDYRVALFGFYLANKLYEEALSLVEDDVDVKSHFLSNIEELRWRIRGLA